MSDLPTPPASAEPPATSPPPPRRWDWRPKARWFAAEYLIVVLGVLTAVALNAWWQGRQDAAREQEYLVQLVEDLRQTEDTYETMEPLWSRRDSSVGALVRSFRSEALPLADSVLTWTGEVVSIQRPFIVTGTADALVETGDINLIRDDSLRSSITQYIDRMDIERSHLEHIDEEARPFIFTLTERVDFIEGWFGGIPPAIRDSLAQNTAWLPLPEGPQRTVRSLNVEALFRDQAAYTAVSNLWRLRFYMGLNRENVVRETVALREQIEAELDR